MHATARIAQRRVGRWTVAALLLCMAWFASAAPAAVKRQSVTVELPGPAYLITPYIDTNGEALLVHLQPRRGEGEERLIDARSGQRWSGDPQAVMAGFTRLGTEAAREVASGRAWDQQLLAALGCAPPTLFCTSPVDADVVLMLRSSAGGRATLEVVDLRPLLAAMDELMAGRRAADDVAADAAGWRLLELASRSPERRARWLDALRGITTRARWSRVVAAAEQGPRLAQWPMLRSDRADDGRLDLVGELERRGLQLHVAQLARAAMAAADAAPLTALADALLLGTRVGFRGDMASALVDELLQLDPAERRALATRLAAEARERRSHGLLCYSAWMLAEPCATPPPWEASAAPQLPPPTPAAPAATPAPGPGATASSAAPPPVAKTPAPSPSATPTPPRRPATEASPPPSQAPQEWALIRTQPNQGVLLTYDETSGHLAPETGTAAGLAFVARALGPVQEGRFELQVAPNGRAPIALRHGAYRVKVRLVLDYAREDRCQAALLCLFSGSQRHARSERRDLVFTLDPANRYVERRRAEFGHLLPLAADGGARYASTLTQARLAIEDVRFDLR